MKTFYLFVSLTAICCLCACQRVSTETGLAYIIHLANPAKQQAKVGDRLMMRYAMLNANGDTLLCTYWGNEVVEQIIQASPYPGSLMEGLTLLHEGDSVSFFLDTDKILQYTGKLPEKVEKGSELTYIVKVVDVLDEKEYNEQLQKKIQNHVQAVGNEFKQIEDHLKKNNFQMEKTPQGIHYLIQQKGDGAAAAAGDSVAFRYVGKFLDQQTFDDNNGLVLGYTLGKTSVIQGWDIAFTSFLSKGCKARIIIPSPYAFGVKTQEVHWAQPNGEKIINYVPPYTPLQFDIEVVDIIRQPK